MWSHTFPSSSVKYSCPASVTLTSAPIGTAEPESNHTKSPFIDTASGVTYKEGLLEGWQKWNNHYLDQMQHFGNMDQVCRDERPFMLSERCSHNRDQNFRSHSNRNRKPDVASEHQRSDRLIQVLFLTSDFRTLQPSSCRAIFFLAVSEAGSFPSKRLFMTLWLCSCWRATPSHIAIKV